MSKNLVQMFVLLFSSQIPLHGSLNLVDYLAGNIYLNKEWKKE